MNNEPEVTTPVAEQPAAPTSGVVSAEVKKSPYIVIAVLAFLLGAVTMIAVALLVQGSHRGDHKLPSFPDVIIEEYEGDVGDEWAMPPRIEDVPMALELDQEERINHMIDPGFNSDDQRDYSAYYTAIVPQAGVSWLLKPERVDVTVPLVSCYDFQGSATSCSGDRETPDGRYVFYKLGTYFEQDIVYTEVSGEGMGAGEAVIALWNGQDSVLTVLMRHSYDINRYLYTQYRYASTTRFDTTTVLNHLNIPDAYNYSDIRFSSAGGFFGYYYGNVSEFVTTTVYGPLFKVESSADLPGTKRLEYAVRLPGGLASYGSYQEPFMTDDRVPQITWTDGSRNQTSYRGQTGGCGFGDTGVVSPAIPESTLAIVGRADTGEVIYGLKDPAHPIVDALFAMTQGMYYTYENGESKQVTFSREEFLKERGVILFKDSLGNQRLLINTKYGPQAECAKPVIYVYPEEETEITVSVAAEVTKSEPLYDQGWTVVAKPDGTLVHHSGTYTSLFWDGFGYGNYPDVTRGVIVPSNDALKTMEQQLATMGFTTREISDFTEFWKDHIPTQPYTRITWFFTDEMEELAKLTITPAPETLIRVFVDFEGMDTPVAIKEQVLPTFVRSGYTVTEWGGLLR